VAPTAAGIRGQRRDIGLSVAKVGTIDGGGSDRSLSTFLRRLVNKKRWMSVSE
jgi:chromate transport protein ChrA